MAVVRINFAEAAAVAGGMPALGIRGCAIHSCTGVRGGAELGYANACAAAGEAAVRDG